MDGVANKMKQELIDFIARRTHLRLDEIKPELRLAEDIGFYGLDSMSFFKEFFEAFEIKNIEEFDIDLMLMADPTFLLNQ